MPLAQKASKTLLLVCVNSAQGGWEFVVRTGERHPFFWWLELIIAPMLFFHTEKREHNDKIPVPPTGWLWQQRTQIASTIQL
jgi:hypothetical protein